MTLTQEARLDLAPDLLDEMELWFATAPREQVADMLAVWLYDAVHREIAIGTFNLVRFKSAVDAAVRRLWTPTVERQEALWEGGAD